MEIGLSSASFYPYVNTEHSIKLMKEIGFNCGELFLNSFSEYDYEFLCTINNLKEKYNFNINSIHAFSSMFEPYLFDRYKRRQYDMLKIFRQVCNSARTLGANSYTFHGMRLNEGIELNEKFIVDIYNELAYIALENDIKLAQENVSWCKSSNIDFLNMLKNKCKYPIYFTLDIKQAYKAKVEVDEYINVMGDKLVNVHINDRNDIYNCLLPGKGDVNYIGIFRRLKDIGYKGKGIIEVYRENYSDYNELGQSKAFLEKIINVL